MFPDLARKKPIRRNAKHKMVSDICNLGQCLINRSKNKELDKIFIEQSETTSEITDNSEIIADLVKNVAILSEQVRKLEKEILFLKRKEDIIQSDSTRSKESTENDPQNTPSFPPVSPSHPQSPTGTPREEEEVINRSLHCQCSSSNSH